MLRQLVIGITQLLTIATNILRVPLFQTTQLWLKTVELHQGSTISCRLTEYTYFAKWKECDLVSVVIWFGTMSPSVYVNKYLIIYLKLITFSYFPHLYLIRFLSLSKNSTDYQKENGICKLIMNFPKEIEIVPCLIHIY